MSSEDSSTIESKIKILLTKTNKVDALLTYGFIRDIDITNIPDSIINYCIIYAFLKINEWLKGGDRWKIDESKQIATKSKGESMYQTIYANPLISKGKHEWKIKIMDYDTSGSTAVDCYIGIASSMHCLETYFFGRNGIAARDGAKSYSYVHFGNKMDHTMSGSVVYPNVDEQHEATMKRGDIITVHLDMDERTIGFSRNKRYLGVAFENIEVEAYRLAISCYSGRETKFMFV